MAQNLFYQLDDEKKDKILHEALIEFSNNEYRNSSTNKIVNRAGISKGSLFKYFKNKEDLYFDVLDIAIKKITTDIEEDIKQLPKDLFERIIRYSEIELIWCIQNPNHYNLFRRAFNKESDIYNRVIERYDDVIDNKYYELFDDIEDEYFKQNKNRILDIIKWFLEGFNREFMQRKLVVASELDIIKEEYIKSLNEYLTLLKTSLGGKEYGR